jgi:hypothetical protein
MGDNVRCAVVAAAVLLTGCGTPPPDPAWYDNGVRFGAAVTARSGWASDAAGVCDAGVRDVAAGRPAADQDLFHMGCMHVLRGGVAEWRGEPGGFAEQWKARYGSYHPITGG